MHLLPGRNSHMKRKLHISTAERDAGYSRKRARRGPSGEQGQTAKSFHAHGKKGTLTALSTAR